MYHLLLFVHVRPVNQPVITDVALCREKVEGPWAVSWVLWVGNMDAEKSNCTANSDVTKFVCECFRFVGVISSHKHACSVA